MEHTPIPWTYEPVSGEIYSIETGRHIATMNRNGMDSHPEWTAKDAAFIVQCCNAHAVLLEACRVMKQANTLDLNVAVEAALQVVREKFKKWKRVDNHKNKL